MLCNVIMTVYKLNLRQNYWGIGASRICSRKYYFLPFPKDQILRHSKHFTKKKKKKAFANFRQHMKLCPKFYVSRNQAWRLYCDITVYTNHILKHWSETWNNIKNKFNSALNRYSSPPPETLLVAWNASLQSTTTRVTTCAKTSFLGVLNVGSTQPFGRTHQEEWKLVFTSCHFRSCSCSCSFIFCSSS